MKKTIILIFTIVLTLLTASQSFAVVSRAQICEERLLSSPDRIFRASEDLLRKNLNKLREQCEPDCEKNGVFGPDSMMWEVSKVPFLALLAETELYLQLAHPAGAQGVLEHSRILKNPSERFRSTFDFIWKMTYGSFSEAERLSLLLHRIHSKVGGTMLSTAGRYQKGQEYSANDQEALLLVHVVHWYSVAKIYEIFVQKLGFTKLNQFVADTKKFGMMLGLSEEIIPQDWHELEQYMRDMISSGALEYTPEARQIEKHFRDLSKKAEEKSLFMWGLRSLSDRITAYTLPQKIAYDLGFKKSPIDEALYEATVFGMKKSYQKMPRWVQVNPMYTMAMDRVAGKPPKPSDQVLYRFLTGK